MHPTAYSPLVPRSLSAAEARKAQAAQAGRVREAMYVGQTVMDNPQDQAALEAAMARKARHEAIRGHGSAMQRALGLVRGGTSLFRMPRLTGASGAGASGTGAADAEAMSGAGEAAGSARTIEVPLQQGPVRTLPGGELLIRVFGDVRVPRSPLEQAFAAI